ncbi:MAG TPA: hypothetical protein VJA23_02765 [Candidatus Nanoarchaeia archaeon]|nr:hypothetical protein [Candidatus Nanoarchaeia archaeon]
MKKRILIFTVLFLISSISVYSGCFLYPESTYYCSDLSQEQAEQECTQYSCQLETVFFSEASCGDNQLFSECTPILCKGSCTKELLGKCSSGAVPQGEEEIWCSSGGCCQFDYLSGSYCNYKSSKALCEIEAKNKDVQQFGFDSLISQEQCPSLCSQQQLNLDLETVSGSILGKETSSSLSVISGVEVKDFTDINPPQDFTFLILTFLAILTILGVIVYYLFAHPKLRKRLFFKIKELFSPQKSKSTSYKETGLKWYTPFTSSPELLQKINFFKKKREQKVKEHQREEFLAASGLTPIKAVKDDFSNLKRVVGIHQRRKKYHPEKSSFQNLEEVVIKVKEREEKIIKERFFPQPQEKQNIKETFSKLRDIAQGKR